MLIETSSGRLAAKVSFPTTAQPVDVSLALRACGWKAYKIRFDPAACAWVAKVIDWDQASSVGGKLAPL